MPPKAQRREDWSHVTRFPQHSETRGDGCLPCRWARACGSRVDRTIDDTDGVNGEGEHQESEGQLHQHGGGHTDEEIVTARGRGHVEPAVHGEQGPGDPAANTTILRPCQVAHAVTAKLTHRMAPKPIQDGCHVRTT